MNMREHYFRIRREHPTTPARYALQQARREVKIDEIMAVIDWQEPEQSHGPFAVGAMPDGAAVSVYWDEEPYDWGDHEPTEEERESLTVIGTGARVAGEDEDLDSVWGYGFIQRDGQWWGSDWEREAISFALECGWFERARLEITERAEWAARDTITV